MIELHEDAEYVRLLAEERLMLAATELIAEAMERQGVNRKQLAEKLGVSQGEVTQRLSGTRNLTLRSLADMLHVLDAEAKVVIRYREAMPQSVNVPVLNTVATVPLSRRRMDRGSSRLA